MQPKVRFVNARCLEAVIGEIDGVWDGYESHGEAEAVLEVGEFTFKVTIEQLVRENRDAA